MKKLNIDNPFFEMMGRLGDVIAVNLLFIVCSLPIVTMGAALTAMYGVFWRMEKGTEGSVGRTYLRCFREKLKGCTPVWMGMMAAGVLLIFDVIFLGHVGMQGIWKAVGVGAGCLILLWELVFVWIFSLMALREIGGREALKEAFRMGVLRLPATLLMILLNNILLICLAVDLYYVMAVAPLYLVFGFAGVAYVNTRIMKGSD